MAGQCFATVGVVVALQESGGGGGGGEDFAATLAIGNSTGANNIVVSGGSSILASAALPIDAVAGITIGASTATSVQVGRAGVAPTAPGAGTGSEAWGSGASATGDNSLAVGPGATADVTTTEDRMTAVGASATASGDNSTAVGFQTTAAGIGSVALGSDALVSSAGLQGVAIGLSALITGPANIGIGRIATDNGFDDVVVIGNGASGTGAIAVALGTSSTAAAKGTALGGLARVLHSPGIALGARAVTTAANQFVVGEAVAIVDHVFLGAGTSAGGSGGRTLIVQASPAGANVDQQGWDFVLACGPGTGLGAEVDFIIQTPATGVTGTALQVLTDRLTINETAATFTVPLALPLFAVAGVPSASPQGQFIFVTDEGGGPTPAFSDGTDWRRTRDRMVISV